MAYYLRASLPPFLSLSVFLLRASRGKWIAGAPGKQVLAAARCLKKIWSEVAENERGTFTTPAMRDTAGAAYRANVCAVIYPRGSRNLLRPLSLHPGGVMASWSCHTNAQGRTR